MRLQHVKRMQNIKRKRKEVLHVKENFLARKGKKKFFTQEMSDILLAPELQLQGLGPVIRNCVYSHLEAFVPCNKETLVKRLKKLHLNVQVSGRVISTSWVL